MKKLLLLLTLLLCLPAWAQNSWAYRRMALPFLLQIQGEARLSCTATMLRTGTDSCRLVTNAHCFDRGARTLTLVELGAEEFRSVTNGFSKLRQFPNDLKSQRYTTSLLKIEPGMDLAELSIPAKLKKNYCPALGILDQESLGFRIDGSSNEASFLTLGYHAGRMQENYTRNSPWDSRVKIAPRGTTPTSLPKLKHLLRFFELKMLPGMSGGPCLSNRWRLVGINRRYIPFQDVTDVIPMPDVLRFLESEGDPEALDDIVNGNLKEIRPEINSGANGNENSGANGNENSGANGNENSGANGNENSGANGNENLSPSPLQHLIKLFSEPAEGVNINGSILLALGPFQIDGLDDYRAHKDEGLAPVYLGDKTFNEGRRSLGDRLAGSYGNLFMGALMERTNSASKLFSMRGSDPVSMYAAGHSSHVTITPKSRGFSIVVESTAQEYFSSENTWGPDFKLPAKTDTFSATLAADGVSYELVTPRGNNLKCDNRSYLKLICSGATESFSLSLTSQIGGALSFRHVQDLEMSAGNGGPHRIYTMYSFGTLMRTDYRR